ncbi:MAG: 50S ribosomal protein L18 [Candidatus Marinimicrobia bacterium]|nr:50S ribosomal protein L18 [Candidatus Neomarinimicrobiota bacterium]
MADKKKTKWQNWEKKRRRIKNGLKKGSAPRLVVYRSNRNIFAQIIDDIEGKTIISASTIDKNIREQVDALTGMVEKGKFIGKTLGDRAVEKNVVKIIFDRNGYKYHGIIKALADSAREAGLQF